MVAALELAGVIPIALAMMRLTSAGELFIHYVRQRNAALDQVRSEIEDLKGLRRGQVRIIASQALAPVFLPEAIATFRRSHPLVDFDVRIGDRKQALAALRSYDSDLTLTFNLEPTPDVTRLAGFEQKLVIMLHRDHPLAQARTPIRLRQCADYPIVMPDLDTGGRQLLERFLSRSSLRLKPVTVSNSFEFLRGCLLHDQALSFQIELGAVSDGDQLVYREIEDRGFPRGQLVLAHLRDRPLPVIASAFASHLEFRLSSLQGVDLVHDAADI